MHKYFISALQALFFAFCFFTLLPVNLSAQVSVPVVNAAYTETPPTGFSNPLLKSAGGGCTPDNLRNERFAADLLPAEREKLCAAVGGVAARLQSRTWSPELTRELAEIWRVLTVEAINLRRMPKDLSSQILAMATPFPDRTDARIFTAAVYVRLERIDSPSFFPILMHELRHVRDFHDVWHARTTVDSLELERRACLLVGKLIQEMPEKESFAGTAKFWKESWRRYSPAEISMKREAAIRKYLRGRKLYRELAIDPVRRRLDFSYLNANRQSAEPERGTDRIAGKKDGVRLPLQKPLPVHDTVLPQNVQTTTLNLRKPVNLRDVSEILRVALDNEKKLYYGMSNFVYDQKLAFQCLKAGKVSASFADNHLVARNDRGEALFAANNAPATLPCILNYSDLETDFTDTFWASPALEKMPIYSNGFQNIDGQNLAVYTVLKPSERVFNEMANEYPQIRPFRIPVGTIYVSPEDGQIVRFAGTSYPETTVTGDYARTVHCTYNTKAVRQKLNIENGLWVTVQVGTVAVANVKGKFHAFNYTVNFENYRQSETDVKILDEDETAAVSDRSASQTTGFKK